LLRLVAALWASADGARERGGEERWLAERGQRNEDNVIAEEVAIYRCHGEREACLSNTAGSGQGEQARLSLAE
jgi:hypothetical protein